MGEHRVLGIAKDADGLAATTRQGGTEKARHTACGLGCLMCRNEEAEILWTATRAAAKGKTSPENAVWYHQTAQGVLLRHSMPS